MLWGMYPGAVSTKSTVCQEVLFPLESITLTLFFFFKLFFLFAFFFLRYNYLASYLWRLENCSFAVEHFFVICPPLPSNMTASLTPRPLLSGAYINVDAAFFLLPPPFPIKFCVTLCMSGVSGIHRHWCHLECNCTETSWELNFLHRTAGRCLHSADVGLYLGAVRCMTWGPCLCSVTKSCVGGGLLHSCCRSHCTQLQEVEAQCYDLWGCWVRIVCC